MTPIYFLSMKMIRHKKFTSEWTLEINRVVIEVLFLKGNADETLKEWNMVIANEFGFESQLCEGKVLTLHTSVVLNGNLLVSFVIVFSLKMFEVPPFIKKHITKRNKKGNN